MKRRREFSNRYSCEFEQCEDRVLNTLVFAINGNAYGPTQAGGLTAIAAHVLHMAHDQVIQLSTPPLTSRAAFLQVASQVERLSRGQPIGIVGFSAGGTLAVRLAGVPSLNVVDVLDYYGPPDLRDYLAYHHGDKDDQYIESHNPPDQSAIDQLSGPSDTTAYVVAAFGLKDTNVVPSVSTADLEQDFPRTSVYTYNGGHGVTIAACPPAVADFFNHL